MMEVVGVFRVQRMGALCLLFIVFFMLALGQDTTAWMPGAGKCAPTELFGECPAGMVVSLHVGQSETTVSWSTPTTTSDSGHLTVTSSHAPGEVFGLGETTVTYNAIDQDGNIDTCAFSITITAPRIYGCPDRTLTRYSDRDVSYATVTWTEPQILHQSADSILTSDHVSGDRFYIGNTTVTYTLTDNGPFAEICQFIITVIDVESPIFTSCPSSIEMRVLSSVDCDRVMYWTLPSAQDNDGRPTITGTHIPGVSLFACGLTAVTYTAVDGSGNMAYCSFNVTLNVGAYVNCPDDVTGENSPGSFLGTATWEPPSILDRHSEWVESVSHAPGDLFIVGTTNVTYKLSGTSGATDVCRFLVTILDVEPPVIQCPADIVLVASSPEGEGEAVSWMQPLPSDNVLIDSIWSNHKPGDVFPVGDTVVIYRTNDTAGLTAFCNFTVTVQDNVYRIFTQIMDHIFVDNDEKILEVSNVAECLHACIEEVEFFCKSAEVTSTLQCRLSREIARSGDELVSQAGATYFEKLGDNTPPTLISCPGNLTGEADDGEGFTDISWLQPLVMDDGGTVSLSSSHQSGQLFYIGITKVVYTAEDEFFNTATCSFYIHVTDTQHPVIQDCPTFIPAFLHAGDAAAAVGVSWPGVRAYDNSGQVTVTVSQEPGSMFGPGEHAVTYTAVDPSGNQASCSFIVSVHFIEASHRFVLRLVLLRLVYTESLADPSSDQHMLLASSLHNQVDDAFKNDVAFLDSSIVNITMFEGGGVAIVVSLGFSTLTSHDSKRGEIGRLLTSLMDDGLADANVDQVQVIEDDGAVIEVDLCYVLPCPEAMTCKIQDGHCVSYCSDNQDYCLNGFCVRPTANNIISCLCSTYEYYGPRCGLQDRVNEPRAFAVLLSCIWGLLLLIFIVLALPITLRKCKQTDSDSKGSNNTLLEKPDIYSTSESDDDDYNGHTNKKELGPDIGRDNPVFMSDEQTSHTQTEHGNEENGFVLMTECKTTTRSMGDGKSNGSNETSGSDKSIELTIMSEPIEGVEGERVRTTQDEPCGYHNDKDMQTSITLATTDDANAPADEAQALQSVMAVVHTSEDGNVEFRGPLECNGE